MGAPLPAQHGARKLFGSMPKATQSPRLGQRLCAYSRGKGRAKKASTTLLVESSRLPGTGRQTPAISRTTAAGLPGGQHGTQRMQQLAGAYGRPEGLSAGPRFVLAQAPAENGLSCGTHGGPGEDASAEQNGRGEFSKPTKAPGHDRAQERYGEKRAREKRRRSVTLPSFFDEPARCGRTK